MVAWPAFTACTVKVTGPVGFFASVSTVAIVVSELTAVMSLVDPASVAVKVPLDPEARAILGSETRSLAAAIGAGDA